VKELDVAVVKARGNTANNDTMGVVPLLLRDTMSNWKGNNGIVTDF
jgi:hypothetical protein